MFPIWKATTYFIANFVEIRLPTYQNITIQRENSTENSFPNEDQVQNSWNGWNENCNEPSEWIKSNDWKEISEYFF